MRTAIKRISLAGIALILLVLVLAAGFSAGLQHHFHPSAPSPHYPPAANALEAQRQDLRYFRQLIELDRSFEPPGRTEANRRQQRFRSSAFSGGTDANRCVGR